MGENLLPCNAAARLQALGSRDMSPLAQLDRLLDNILRELTLRFVVPRLSEFDAVGISQTGSATATKSSASPVPDRSSVALLTARATKSRFGMLLRPVISAIGKKYVGASDGCGRDVPHMVVFPFQTVSQIRDPKVRRNSYAIHGRPAA